MEYRQGIITLYIIILQYLKITLHILLAYQGK